MYKGEDKILKVLAAKGKLPVLDVAKECGMNPDSVRRAAESLKAAGYITITAHSQESLSAEKELREYFSSGVMPELSVYRKAAKGKSVADLSPAEKSIGLRWAKVKGLVNIEAGKLVPTKTKEEAEAANAALLDAAKAIGEGKKPGAVILDEMFHRKLVKKTISKTLLLEATGKKYVPEAAGFNISAEAADAPLGKSHPVTRLRDKVRSIMADLGFQEMDGGIVESSFWNFDALFQPQDHPARELADTFYVKGESSLPKDRALVERVKKAHEGGWRYDWSEKDAKKTILRTHTTALSARYLAAMDKSKPTKLFAVGKVFRNEATDFKHLAEFYQVEGIVAWKGASFRDLLGILKEFYRKLGFEKIRFRPSFFPYTEPSLEVEVFFEPRQEWLELGGAGIFRPEVSEPLCGVYPVLAWGLSLERPLMLTLGLDDIRTFYRNDADFLRNTRMRL